MSRVPCRRRMPCLHTRPQRNIAAKLTVAVVQVHALGWMRTAQLAWYAASIAGNCYTVLCAVVSIRGILRMHAYHASLPNTTPPSCPSRPSSLLNRPPDDDVRQPLLGPVTSSGSATSTRQPPSPRPSVAAVDWEGGAMLAMVAQSRLLAPRMAPSTASDGDVARAEGPPWPVRRGCTAAQPAALKSTDTSATAASVWPPNSLYDQLPGRPKAHAYCTLPAAGSKLHAYRPCPPQPLSAALALRPLPTPAESAAQPAMHLSTADLRSTQHAAEQDLPVNGVERMHGGHALPVCQGGLPWLPGWGCAIMRLRRRCPRTAWWIFYAVYVSVGCVHVWATQQVALWNRVAL